MPGDNTGAIQNIEELQSIIGKPHNIIKAKVQSKLDVHCLYFLQQSSIVFLGYRYDGRSEILILDGAMGFVDILNYRTLHLPEHREFSMIENEVFQSPIAVSLYCWIPGIEETLRINGEANWLHVKDRFFSQKSGKGRKVLRVRVKGAFIHCGKSVKRSGLWKKRELIDFKVNTAHRENELINSDHKKYIAQSSFLCLFTRNASDRSELSPRGDPPGSVSIISNKYLLIPDRPGNKRLDSMLNLLSDSRIGITFLIPGSDILLLINGQASIVKDSHLLKLVAVNNKIPRLSLLVTVKQCRFRKTSSLNWPTIWTQSRVADRSRFPSLGKILIDQTTKKKSLLSSIKGKLIEAFIQIDYKKNLY